MPAVHIPETELILELSGLVEAWNETARSASHCGCTEKISQIQTPYCISLIITCDIIIFGIFSEVDGLFSCRKPAGIELHKLL